MVGKYLSLFYSVSEKPLEYWSKQLSPTGRIRRILDSNLLENVLEIQDLQQDTIENTSISCPPNSNQLLDIRLPILAIVMKNLDTKCQFRIQVIDDQDLRYYFQFYTVDCEKRTSNRYPLICHVKVHLESGWNRLELDLASLTENAFKRRYAATQRLEICANCRLRRIYFADKNYNDSKVWSELCQGFFDNYMLKWGIHLVERSTQTRCNRKRNSKKDTEHNESTDNVTDELNEQSDSRSIKQDKNLLRNIQAKSDRLIDGFLSRRDISAFTTDFKQQIKPKSYVFPGLTARSLFNKNFSKSVEYDWSSNEQNFRTPIKIEDNYKTFKVPIFPTTLWKKECKEELEEAWTRRYTSDAEKTSASNTTNEVNVPKKRDIKSRKVLHELNKRVEKYIENYAK